ncbi:MAG: hypothetical protein HZA93_07735 [Verrucomicrobia bacterium]|nr:hypothetical protein [Verrucomicrobiota bacterium]
MIQRLYALLRDLHLYFGLFVSPFVLVFAVSVVFLVHAWLPKPGAAPAKRTVTDITLPADFESLKGPAQLAAAHAVLAHLGVQGEIGFVRQLPRERRFVFPVSVPGRETTVDLNVAQRTATLSTRTTGLWDATVYLHKMPGPHNVAIRGNAAFMRVWRWLADATVYLLLFVSLSGVYLWAVLKTERRIGLVLLAAGAATFGGLVYALV